MADVKVPYLEAGQAAFEPLDSYSQGFLLSGDHPRLASYPLEAAEDQIFSQFEVVGYDEDGNLVPATWAANAANAVQAIGVITQALDTTGRSGVTVPTFYSGNFNPDALVWDDSFDTEEKKMLAFNGAPTPTQISLRKRG